MMLSKAHLTWHSRISGSMWVITPSWLCGPWRFFLYSSCVYSYHLFLISSVSVRSLPFLSFIEPIFAWNISLVPLTFLKRSLVFSILLFSSISLHCSLRKALVSLLAILGTLHSNGYIFPFLLYFLLLFFSQLLVRPPQTAILLFCISFSWEWRIDAKAETPILWPPDVKNWVVGKDPVAKKNWRQEEKGMTED